MVMGGFPPLDDVELVDLSPFQNNTCTKPHYLPANMDGAVSTFIDGNVVICGGFYNDDCFTYSFVNDAWTKVASLPEPRHYPAAVMVDEDTWWITGGRSGSDYWDSTIVYKDGIITPGPDLPYQSEFHCLVKLNSTHILLNGGYYKGQTWASTYIFEWTTKTWTQLGDMETRRRGHTCGLVGNNVVVVGGETLGAYLDSSEVFSLDTNTWSEGPQAPREIKSSQAIQRENTFLIVGGFDFDGADYIADIFEVDEKTFKLHKMPQELTKSRAYHTAVVIDPSNLSC